MFSSRKDINPAPPYGYALTLMSDVMADRALGWLYLDDPWDYETMLDGKLKPFLLHIDTIEDDGRSGNDRSLVLHPYPNQSDNYRRTGFFTVMQGLFKNPEIKIVNIV
jgi:hypothetical protein